MSRIGRAFERRFQELLGEFGARDREKGVRWLFSRARELAERKGGGVSRALAEQNIILIGKLRRFQVRKGAAIRAASRVVCDAGLGGLARWLRACGCEAHWTPDIGDSELVAQAEALGAVIITTDSFLLDRKAVTSGRLRAIWVPPTLTKLEQLRLALAELNLPETETRCMRCGGELREVDKEAVKQRIPPKTYAWVNEYFECGRCGQLFWRGTHWERVNARLRETMGPQ